MCVDLTAVPRAKTRTCTDRPTKGKLAPPIMRLLLHNDLFVADVSQEQAFKGFFQNCVHQQRSKGN